MIGVLIFPDFQLLDAAGPISVFEIAARVAGKPPAIKTIAVTQGAVRSSSGVEMLARSLRPFGAITTFMAASVWASSMASGACASDIRWLTMRSKGRRSRLAAISRIEGR